MIQATASTTTRAAFDEDAPLDVVSGLLTSAMLASLFRRDRGAQGAIVHAAPAKPAPTAARELVLA